MVVENSILTINTIDAAVVDINTNDKVRNHATEADAGRAQQSGGAAPWRAAQRKASN
jgi:hypothetical protein